MHINITLPPWRADGLLVKCQKSHVIADTQCVGEIDIPFEECIENAKLIAAAPELYYACISAIKALSGRLRAGERMNIDDVTKDLWNAVAKAEGRFTDMWPDLKPK